MGIIENSFKRELGKNTGKWVSNVVFGDGHSTPYRRVGNRQQTTYQEPRKTKTELLHEERLERIEAEERLQAKRLQIEREQKKKEQLLIIDSAVLKNIDTVAAIKIPTERNELINVLSELATQIKANKWHKNDEEGKIRNKFFDALLGKYEQCVIALKSIDTDSPQLDYYKKIARTAKNKKFFKKHKFLLFIGAILTVFICYFYPLYVIIIASVVGVFLIVKKIIKSKNKVSINQKKSTVQKTEQKIEDYSSVSTEKPLEENIVDSIFFDLNENGRIEKRLSSIWAQYANHVDKKIINRKPIFSADGVKDSILYIGVNPSYNPSDDTTFISSEDNKSLLYGSLYQLPNAPDYFKALESFASKLNIGYTHINLLYARENDRDLLLKTDHNFIREQLELTYDTLKKINPVAIIFFSDYCKSLIFGEERWISPKSEVNEHFILKGTNFPVFFTDDITILNSTEQNELIHRIQQII